MTGDDGGGIIPANRDSNDPTHSNSHTRAAQVRAAVAQLPTAERQAVSLAYYGGLTYREVAHRLGLAEGTVKSQIRRALTRLAHVLESATTVTG